MPIAWRILAIQEQRKDQRKQEVGVSSQETFFNREAKSVNYFSLLVSAGCHQFSCVSETAWERLAQNQPDS